MENEKIETKKADWVKKPSGCLAPGNKWCPGYAKGTCAICNWDIGAPH